MKRYFFLLVLFALITTAGAQSKFGGGAGDTLNINDVYTSPIYRASGLTNFTLVGKVSQLDGASKWVTAVDQSLDGDVFTTLITDTLSKLNFVGADTTLNYMVSNILTHPDGFPTEYFRFRIIAIDSVQTTLIGPNQVIFYKR